MTRETFEEITSDLFDRVQGPIRRALEGCGMEPKHLDQVILYGGGESVSVACRLDGADSRFS